MKLLRNCRKAEIFSPSDEFLCQAEVFTDKSEQLWVSVPHSFSYEEHSYYNITFYDSVSGLVRGQCILGSPQDLSERRLALMCDVTEVVETRQRRQDLKIPLEIEVEVTCIYLPEGVEAPPQTFPAVTRNISAGGIYLISEYPLAEGAEIQFEIKEASKPLVLTAKLLRQEKLPPKMEQPQYGYGCRFIKLKSQMESVLRNYIFRKDRERQRGF